VSTRWGKVQYNLLDVLNVDTPEEVLEELHQRLTQEKMGGLKLGMYLDLTNGLNDRDSLIPWNESEQNMRIVIAHFNQYKNMDNGDNHIKFVFKNSPVKEQMRTPSRNKGGYPYNGTDNGTPVLRPYLEGPFLEGLKTALGIPADVTYFYKVKRDIIIGEKGSWELGTLEAEIFIDTYMEATGDSSAQEKEIAHTQTALYQVDPTWATRAGGDWWTATPCKPDSTSQFYTYSGFEPANKTTIGVVPAFCIK
jgi:hypothetical protein